MLTNLVLYVHYTGMQYKCDGMIKVTGVGNHNGMTSNDAPLVSCSGTTRSTPAKPLVMAIHPSDLDIISVPKTSRVYGSVDHLGHNTLDLDSTVSLYLFMS